MRFSNSLAVSMLAAAAVARPRTMEEGDPVSQTARITAFVIDDKGNPSVECWEINALSNSYQMSTRRADGSKATGYVTPIASYNDDLQGVDLLTWTEPSPIWPPGSGIVQSQWFDLAFNFNLFAVQGGLVRVDLNLQLFRGENKNDDEVDTHIFSLENGDDWFYFEDSTDSSLARTKSAPEAPIVISTASGGNTELLRLRYESRPTYRVIHKGACSFTGIQIPEPSARREKNSPLSVQVNIEDSRGL